MGLLLTIEGRTVRLRAIERFSEQIITGIVVPLLTEPASFLLDVVRIIPGRRLQPCFLYFGNVKISKSRPQLLHFTPMNCAIPYSNAVRALIAGAGKPRFGRATVDYFTSLIHFSYSFL